MAGELERFGGACASGVGVGAGLGAAVGTVIPGAGNAIGGAIGAGLGCLVPGAIAAWGGQTSPPLLPSGGTVSTQVPLLVAGAQRTGGLPTQGAQQFNAGSGAVQFRAEGAADAAPAKPSPLPLLLAGLLLAAVVAWALSRRRRR